MTIAAAGASASTTSNRLEPPMNRPSGRADREAGPDQQRLVGHRVEPALRVARGILRRRRNFGQLRRGLLVRWRGRARPRPERSRPRSSRWPNSVVLLVAAMFSSVKSGDFSCGDESQSWRHRAIRPLQRRHGCAAISLLTGVGGVWRVPCAARARSIAAGGVVGPGVGSRQRRCRRSRRRRRQRCLGRGAASSRAGR